jgi:hypothetical protein
LNSSRQPNWLPFSPQRSLVAEKGERTMVKRQLTLAEIMLIAGTRVALGVGIGLLLSSKLRHRERKAAGLALTLVGGLTTVPLALNVLGKKDIAATSEIRPIPQAFPSRS